MQRLIDTFHPFETAEFLLRTLHPDWTNDQIKSQILLTVDPLPSLEEKMVSGGRLNAAAAVTAVPELTHGDFNDDSFLTDTDIDLLSSAVGSVDIMFDLDGNGAVEEEDRRIWVEDMFGTFFGDADLNKEVAFADFLALSSNFGLDGGWAKGDFDGSGDVQFPDFVLLANNFGKSATVVAAVPEPNAAMLLLVGLFGFVRMRWIVSKNVWPR